MSFSVDISFLEILVKVCHNSAFKDAMCLLVFPFSPMKSQNLI